MIKDWQSQAHVRWECKYHVLLVSKYRSRKVFERVRRQVGEILRDLCRQKGLDLLEVKAMPDRRCKFVSHGRFSDCGADQVRVHGTPPCDITLKIRL